MILAKRPRRYDFPPLPRSPGIEGAVGKVLGAIAPDLARPTRQKSNARYPKVHKG